MNRNAVSERIRNVATEALAKYNGKLGLTYDWDEISKHNTRNDFWTVVGGYVYDLTAYLNYHPGGFNLLYRVGGQNATNDFEAMFHSKNARLILECFCIGRLKGASKSSSSASASQMLSPSTTVSSSSNFLSPSFKPSTVITTSTTTTNQFSPPTTVTISNNTQSPSFKNFEGKIISKDMVSHNTFKMIVEIPTDKAFDKSEHWINPLTHVSFANLNNEYNSYTPINATINGTKTNLHFLIKEYENGNVSKFISNLSIGDTFKLRGPIKTHQEFKLETYSNPYLICIVGGTGITPIIQMLNILFPIEKEGIDKIDTTITTNSTILTTTDTSSPTLSSLSISSTSTNSSTSTLHPTLHLILIYSNSKSTDILYKKELEAIQQRYPNQFTLYHVLTKESSSPSTSNDSSSSSSLSSTSSTSSIKTYYGRRINFDLLGQCYLNHPSLTLENNDVILCGPVEFNQSLRDQLSTIGYQKNKVILLE